MIGDATGTFENEMTEVEVGLMIADQEYRGKGYGSELLNLLVKYLKENFKVRHHVCSYE